MQYISVHGKCQKNEESYRVSSMLGRVCFIDTSRMPSLLPLTETILIRNSVRFYSRKEWGCPTTTWCLDGYRAWFLLSLQSKRKNRCSSFEGRYLASDFDEVKVKNHFKYMAETWLKTNNLPLNDWKTTRT